MYRRNSFKKYVCMFVLTCKCCHAICGQVRLLCTRACVISLYSCTLFSIVFGTQNAYAHVSRSAYSRTYLRTFAKKYCIKTHAQTHMGPRNDYVASTLTRPSTRRIVCRCSQRGLDTVHVLTTQDPLFMLYTSGSTGKPKGVLHTTAGYMTWAATTFKVSMHQNNF